LDINSPLLDFIISTTTTKALKFELNSSKSVFRCMLATSGTTHKKL
jgi:hypothetical protein